MKLLLDENLPRQLKMELAGHTVFTAAEMGWSGKENGELLSLLLENNFQALLTGDKNIPHQQNFKTYTIPVIVLNTRFITYPDLKPLMPIVQDLLKTNLRSGPIVVSL